MFKSMEPLDRVNEISIHTIHFFMRIYLKLKKNYTYVLKLENKFTRKCNI